MAERIETFFWDRTAAVLTAAHAEHRLTLDVKRRAFVANAIRVHPPLVLPIAAEVDTLGDFLVALPDAPTLHMVILLQAGAAALGLFEHGETLHTKTIKKYVVRGRGKAQPTYAAAKGKSRYGSRLRLQNARQLLVDVNEKLHEWVDEFGPPDHVFYNCPVRAWPELFLAKVPPPFATDDPVIKIPLDVPVPTTDVLLRTYKGMCYGRVEYGRS